jgi:hypothetical protein
VQKIRDFLAMRREYPQQQAEPFAIPAEDPGSFGKKPNGDVPKAK